MKQYHIYVLSTTKCRKVYIGITTDPVRRLRQHLSCETKMWKKLTKAGRAVKRYGADSFSLTVKATTASKTEAARIEQEWISRFGPKRLWNSSRGGEYKRDKEDGQT